VNAGQTTTLPGDPFLDNAIPLNRRVGGLYFKLTSSAVSLLRALRNPQVCTASTPGTTLGSKDLNPLLVDFEAENPAIAYPSAGGRITVLQATNTNITGTYGSLDTATKCPLNVSQLGNVTGYHLAATHSLITILAGSADTSRDQTKIDFQALAKNVGNATLTLSTPCAPNLTCSFRDLADNPLPGNTVPATAGGGDFRLRVTAGVGAPSGAFPITIIGSQNQVQRATTTVTALVLPSATGSSITPTNVGVAVSPAGATISVGGSTSFTIQLTAGTLVGPVALSLQCPAEFICTNPNPAVLTPSGGASGEILFPPSQFSVAVPQGNPIGLQRNITVTTSEGNTTGSVNVAVTTGLSLRMVSVNQSGNPSGSFPSTCPPNNPNNPCGSTGPFVSQDGRSVAFGSIARDLVAGITDGNNVGDIFVRDTVDNMTLLVSKAFGSFSTANGPSQNHNISDDGNFVSFASRATNLEAGPPPVGPWHIYVWSRSGQSGTITRIPNSGSADDSGPYFPTAISKSGTHVAYVRKEGGTGTKNVFLWDGVTNTRVSSSPGGAAANGQSENPSISDDGRFVVFDSCATNLLSTPIAALPPDGSRCGSHVYRWDRNATTNKLTLLSRAADGTPGNRTSAAPDMSGDGQLVVFESLATNLTQGDTNGTHDVFFWQGSTGQLFLASVSSSGTLGNNDSTNPTITNDGQFVAFDSLATNLVPDDTNGTHDIFLHDLWSTTTSRFVALGTGGGGDQPNAVSRFPQFSADGGFLTFTSIASNLVSGDSNGRFDVFFVQTR
jgi:hypothetical protein